MGSGTLPDVVNGYHWELYNITEDYSEYNDLAAKQPEKLKELQALFLTEAAKYSVFPMDNTLLAGGYAATEHDRRASCFHVLGREFRYSPLECSQPVGQGLHHHRRGDDP